MRNYQPDTLQCCFDNFKPKQKCDAAAYVLAPRMDISVLYSSFAAQDTDALPEVTISPDTQVVKSGSVATFTCDISSPSAFNVSWLHNGTPATGARFTMRGHELAISNLSEDLTGNYTCIVANSAGIVSSNVAELQIACE